MKRILISISLLLLMTLPSFAQHSSNAYRNLADSLYDHHHYQIAADYYEKALKKSANTGEIMLQLARCYNKTNLLQESEKWFLRARTNGVPFSSEDNLEFAHVLISLKKAKKADSVLEYVLQQDPNSHHVRQLLDDLRNPEKYYRDSATVKISAISVNTPIAEFAPVYYKDGIVFSSAKQESPFRKKYHWDNSHFLNLYFAPKTTTGIFKEARLFEEDLNTKHHDGPVVFYSQFQKMIVNRNQKMKVDGREDVYEWRPGLYDGQFNSINAKWEVTPLPFNDPAHSYAHPSISEDGNVLYFVSDRPGGYGGMDIYRAVRMNGSWGTPFNVGPTINTAGNESFPFFIENTLYFASEGHGGLGGLDIFTSTQSTNGFTPPVNLGRPINSSDDDFSIITDISKRQGYFASSRTGNDDLFSFQRIASNVRMLAHIFDGDTKAPLVDAHIEIITASGLDITLETDSVGDFSFELPSETAYLIIGNKDNKVGMLADVARDRNDIHQIPAYGDTVTLACIGTIKNEHGNPKIAATITITDLTSGKRLYHPGNQSLVIFQGQKGHNYLIEVKDDLGRQASHQLNIPLHDNEIKRWSLTLPDTSLALNMLCCLQEDNNQPLANASVKVITFGENDQELTADGNGIADFNLPDGTAYVVIGSKDDFAGMHSGSAEKGMDKASIIHPVPAKGDKSSNVLAMGLITNLSGTLVDGHSAVITNKSTGENIPVEMKKGLLTFMGKKGDIYNISVSHDLYKTALQTLAIPSDATDAEKFTVVLEYKMQPEEKVEPFVTGLDYNSISSRVPANTNILFVDSEDGTPGAFILTGDSLREISEEDGTLYLNSRNGKENLGNGTLSKLREDPSSVLKSQTIPVTLRNIYFEFDKANLDNEDTSQLLLVKKILSHDPSLKLEVSGHADDRGQRNYNMKLSERRTWSVKTFLVAQGIEEKRIVEKGFGESQPVVSCDRSDCSEEEHRQNRRAEFMISKNAMNDFVKSRVSPPSNNSNVPNSANYDRLLKNFSETQVDGILFKVTVGAYKKQQNLTFAELSDLGTIESVMSGGITYYYLSNYKTLKNAEEIRHEVIRRGINGASISVFQNGDKITLKKFAALLN